VAEVSNRSPIFSYSVHLAGRVGRVGQQGCVLGDGGHVVSVLTPEEASKMESLANTLGFEFTDLDTFSDSVPLADEMDVEAMRKYLEDTINLVKLKDDPVVDVDAVRVYSENVDNEMTNDDDDEEEDDDEDEDDGAYE